MTEPKYKIDQVVRVPNLDGTYYDAVITDFDEAESGEFVYWVEPTRQCDDVNLFHEDELQPVVIYPDYGEVYCKDCEEVYHKGDHDYFSERCIIDIVETSNFPNHHAIWCFPNDKPPPNCHCFKPRAK